MESIKSNQIRIPIGSHEAVNIEVRHKYVSNFNVIPQLAYQIRCMPRYGDGPEQAVR